MDRCRRMLLVLAVIAAVGLGYLEDPAEAQPTADQLLAEVGLSPNDKQRVLKGEFVTVDIEAVSERDLSTRIVFLVKTSPDALSKQVVAGDLVTADSQVRAHGSFSATGSLTDLKGLRITSDEAKALSGAQAGSALNLSAAEVTAFKSLPSGNPQAVEQQLHRMLLSRYQAYRASGLAGVAPYDRGGGATTELVTDLRKASEAARFLHKYLLTRSCRAIRRRHSRGCASTSSG